MSRTGDCVVASDPLLSGAATGCQLWVKSGPFVQLPKMSAFGGKADVIQGVAECPLIAKSGHWDEGIIAMNFKGIWKISNYTAGNACNFSVGWKCVF